MIRSFKIALGWLCLLVLPVAAHAQIGGTGWKSQTLNFKIQWPYTTNEGSRYWFTNNIYHCLVYSNDSPFQAGSTTLPRTEQRFNPDYTNGEIQYQATIMAASNENSYCVFQIHTGDAQSAAYGSTTFMLFWFTSDGGSVHDYSGTELASNLDNQWFQVNVDHNIVTGTIRVWINKNLVWTQQDNGAGDFYFKDGVYEQGHGPTLQMDSYVTNIMEWVSSGTNPPAAPAGLAATPGTAQIGLLWDSSVGATNYNLKRAITSGGPYTTITSLTGTNYSDTHVTNGVVYYYVVTAVDNFGESANSAQVSASSINPGFKLAVAPATNTLIASLGTNCTVTLTPSNTFNGTVTFGITGLPAGASANFTPPSVSMQGNSSLTIQTSTSSPGGSFPLVISGTNGNVVFTTSATLKITPLTRPVITGAWFEPGSLSLAATGGPAYGTWYLLASTNLTQPLAQWTRIVTKAFDQNGSLSLTNAAVSWTGRQFFILQTP